jgi:hypothetical protein
MKKIRKILDLSNKLCYHINETLRVAIEQNWIIEEKTTPPGSEQRTHQNIPQHDGLPG